MDSVTTQVCNNNFDNEDAELFKAHAIVSNHLLAYAETLALRSAVELRIADILHSHGQPMSLSQLASKLESPSPNLGWLERVMRMLVRKQIFTIHSNQTTSSIGQVIKDEPLYGTTTASKWLLHDQDSSLVHFFLALSDHSFVKPWFEISRSIKDGESPFVKAHGESFYEMASHNEEFNKMFNDGMDSVTKPVSNVVIKGYKEGFSKLEGTIVDIGGGIGSLIAKIVEAYPHLKGVNFDLPHVVANAPQCPGVTHIGGDMFQELPFADNFIIKSTLHNWSDESCLTILKNCRKSLSNKEKGKVLAVDIVLDPFGNGMFDNVAVALDLMMVINTMGGKERTKDDWKKLMKEAGFTHINFIPLQFYSLSVIEAFA